MYVGYNLVVAQLEGLRKRHIGCPVQCPLHRSQTLSEKGGISLPTRYTGKQAILTNSGYIQSIIAKEQVRLGIVERTVVALKTISYYTQT